MRKLTRRNLLGKTIAGCGLAFSNFYFGPNLFAGHSPKSEDIMSEYDQKEMDFYYNAIRAGEGGKEAILQDVNRKIRWHAEMKSLARRCLMTEELPCGALPIYEKTEHKEVISWMAKNMDGYLGEIHKFFPGEWNQYSKKDEVYLLPFELANKNFIEAKQNNKKTLLKIRENIQFCADDIVRQEDKLFIDLLDAASKENLIKKVSSSKISRFSKKNKLRKNLELLYEQVEEDCHVVCRLLMNDKTLEIIKSVLGKNIFDEVSDRARQSIGLMGHIWTADVYRSDLIKDGEIYALPAGEYIGALPIRQDFCTMDTSEIKNHKCKFVIWEEIGMGLIYPEQIAKITI